VELNSTGGSIGEVAITGCTLQHTSKAPGSANIRILGAGTDPSLERRVGRPTTREGNVTISANVFSDVKVNIEVREARGVTITGNTFWEGFEQDILAVNCEHLVISKGCTDTSLTGNVISGVWRQRAAVDITESTRLVISNNHILDSDGAGLRLENVKHSLVTSNLIRDDRPAEKRSKEPSLIEVKSEGNHVSGNLLGNP
jgi:nitrous oxidase accessory protein NosD